MFAVDCPYCQHANKRGARFCADCGAPLHLKPCPKCGKVDDVTARQCGSCGTPFPPMELAEYGAETGIDAGRGPTPAPAVAAAAAPPSPPPAAPASSLRAGPLIVIALVAGGLPFLWMNRERLPSPRTLQGDPPRAAVPGPAPAERPVAPPTASAPPPAPAPAQAIPVQRAEPPASTPAADPAAVPKPDEAPTRTAASDTKSKGSKEARPAGKPARRDDAPERAAGSDSRAPAAECTESLAALRLCDPAQAKK